MMGPAGCGKTSLLEAIIRERRPRTGQIFFRHRPLWGKGCIGRSHLRRQIGVLFQEDFLFQERTVFENVAVLLRLTDSPRATLSGRVYQALTEVGLTSKAKQSAHMLSSSEKRLLSLARVIARRASLVIADLNTCEIDQDVIAPRLENLASYGCGVLIFSKERSRAQSKTPATAELVLR